MRLWLQTQGHGTAAARQAADEAVDQLLTTLRSPQGRWVLAPHDEAVSEWAITTWADGQARTHVIDRTFIAEGIRWIIDYKTTRDDDADATAYREQLVRYRRLFSEGPPVRMGIFFTHRGTFSEVSD
jgi:ATP-dependent exoDNAse (exonuclease V) beta subunit